MDAALPSARSQSLEADEAQAPMQFDSTPAGLVLNPPSYVVRSCTFDLPPPTCAVSVDWLADAVRIENRSCWNDVASCASELSSAFSSSLVVLTLLQRSVTPEL